MKRVGLMLVVAVLGAATAPAQVAVQLRAEKDTFLLYEPIPLTVAIRNQTGRTLSLTNSTETPWLDFLVTDESGRMIKAAEVIESEENVLVPPGGTLSRKVDVMPLYEIRRRGSYRVKVRVRQGEMDAVSTAVNFAVVEGRELWSQTCVLGNDEHRTYSLTVGRTGRDEVLHVCVRDEPKGLVYGLIALGKLLPLVPPEARIDREGNLHVLYQGAPHSFGYVRVDPLAKVIDRMVYSDVASMPRLTVDGGTVAVRGGTQTHPHPERIMTEAELNPPPPPPPPAPKKKWWWPFGAKQPAQ